MSYISIVYYQSIIFYQSINLSKYQSYNLSIYLSTQPARRACTSCPKRMPNCLSLATRSDRLRRVAREAQTYKVIVEGVRKILTGLKVRTVINVYIWEAKPTIISNWAKRSSKNSHFLTIWNRCFKNTFFIIDHPLLAQENFI